LRRTKEKHKFGTDARALEHTYNFVNYYTCSSSELMRGLKRSLDTDAWHGLAMLDF